MNKDIIRKIFIQKRNQLTLVQYDDLCQKLLRQFQQLDLNGIKYLHTFLPIHKRREPDTLLITAWLKAHRPEIKLVYPQTNFANHTMQSFIDDAALVLETNAFDIPEPVSGNQIDAGKIDMILVPLLAFDNAGYRVGYGKGFYDRFMASCGPSTQFIGLSFFDAVDEITDIDLHDVKMHACITPTQLIKF